MTTKNRYYLLNGVLTQKDVHDSDFNKGDLYLDSFGRINKVQTKLFHERRGNRIIWCTPTEEEEQYLRTLILLNPNPDQQPESIQ